MSWEGANILQRRKASKKKKRQHNVQHQRHHDGDANNSPSFRRSKRKAAASSETVEAALNRLSKAYTLAMECVGAWHQAAAASLNTNNNDDDDGDDNTKKKKVESSLKQVAQTTRKTFEQAILLDPLVLKYAPALDQLLYDWERQSVITSWIMPAARTRHSRPVPALLTSAGHRSTVKQLAYLSLVNYADLLLAGCACSSSSSNDSMDSSSKSNNSVLDRGVVSRVLRGGKTPQCCWEIMDSKENSTALNKSAHTSADGMDIDTTTGEELSSSSPSSQKQAAINSIMDAYSSSNNASSKNKEAEHDTVRLAMICLMDATELDGSDPTAWLKLACAARRLGRCLLIQDGQQQQQQQQQHYHYHRYRRLERYALERGQTCLPAHVPRNRTILRAYRQWLQEEEEENSLQVEESALISSSSSHQKQQHHATSQQPLVLELPRYSWAVLGRMLLRACREGSHYHSHPQQQQQHGGGGGGSPSNSVMTDDAWLFASPTVTLKLSPLLSLPQPVLVRLCQYLDAPSTSRLEATCRALSVSVLSARMDVDNINNHNNGDTAKVSAPDSTAASAVPTTTTTNAHDKNHDEASGSNSNNDANHGSSSNNNNKPQGNSSNSNDNKTQREQENASSATNNDNDNNNMKHKGPSPRRHSQQDKSSTQHQGSRASKRLRSQIITSGKRAERSTRRSSIDYCLLAATMGCTPDDPNYLSQLQADGESKEKDEESRKLAASLGITSRAQNTSSTAAAAKTQQEAGERLSAASLSLFVRDWSAQSATPLSLLFGFCAHASMHIGRVYASDHHGSVVLSSCLYDCLDIMVRRTRTYEGLAVSWSTGELKVPQSEESSGGCVGLLSPMELFALDLLHAELRLKRCDRDSDQVDLDYDSDGNIVGILVPLLLTSLDQLDGTAEAKTKGDEWIGLKARCYWLAAGFYLWRGHLSSNIAESRDAEKEGLRFIGRIRSTLEDASSEGRTTDLVISTPHLEGIGRTGLHWKELSKSSLIAFQNEIQASSVVLRAREQFLETASKLKVAVEVDNAEGDSSLLLPTAEEKASFTAIGESLLKRYQSPVESPEAHHSELVDDFLSAHGTAMLSYSLDSDLEELLSWFESLVQLEPLECSSLREVSNPCTLTILVACLVIDEKDYSQLLRVLVNSARTIRCMQQRLLLLANFGKRSDSADLSNDGLSDDMSLMSENDGSPNQAEQLPGDRSSAMRLYARLFWLLVNSICRVVNEKLSDQERTDFSTTSGCSGLVQDVYDFCADWKGVSLPDDSGMVVTEDFCLLQSTEALASSFSKCVSNSSEREELDRLNLLGLVKVLVQQQRNVKDLLAAHSGKGSHPEKRQIKERSNALAVACCDLGRRLSSHLAEVDAGRMRRARIWEGAQSALVPLSGCLLWLWHATASKSSDGNAASFDSQCSRTLRVPVAVAIVGVCGSAVLTQHTGNRREKTNEVSLVDFFDSDDSATEWLSDDEGGDTASHKHEDLLRVTAQVAYCVHHITGSISDDEMTHNNVTHNGPLFPLVMVRVLNFFADILLINFGGVESVEDDEQGDLWADFGLGTRGTGSILDSLLHRSYKAIYGFTIEGKDSSGQNTSDDSEAPCRRPESVAAAAQLYRCLMRAYGHGRKTPPKAAMEIVLSALPPAEETKRSTVIRKYLFSTETSYFDTKSVVSIATKSANWHDHVSAMAGWDWGTWEKDSQYSSQSESVAVRRGLSNLVAQGPLPAYQDCGGTKNPRKQTSQVESELRRKFESILYELSFGNITDCEGWCKLAECCFAKSELVADRLGLTNGYSRADNFYVKERPIRPKRSMAVSELLSEQQKIAEDLRDTGWIRLLGSDLSLFMETSWSSFESLKACHYKIGQEYQGVAATDSKQPNDARAWRVIDRYLTNQDFVAWQQAWGGLFVSCLRAVGIRCMCLALYILYKRIDSAGKSKDKLLVAEIRELLGTSTYSQLVGGQVYGYPMASMTAHQKREIADAALQCFSSCLLLEEDDTSVSEGEHGDSDWDILLMIGKCHEKIAKTYHDEKFTSNSTPTTPSRIFERHEAKALDSYARSLAKAEELEKKGDLIVEQQGGSSHGSVEALYRLHASRLKCLIAAVDRREDERDLAELEALRLTETHWFSKPDDGTVSLESVRDRVWRVVIDVVEAFIQCRKQNSFFHRSVYRHAQALMWAPVLSDPVTNRAEGSHGTVPATHAYKLRGLSSDSAIESASAVINSLFEKKRVQLCAVWVTSVGNPSPLQQINTSIRKYDSLRGKYIKAYVESMRLSKRKNDMEQLLRSANLCPRDLPSYFVASAECEGGLPRKALHTSDCLLVKRRSLSSQHFITSVKRQANAALAAVILQEARGGKASSGVGVENQLKLAYSCFLRLNCDPSALLKSRNRMSDGVRPILDALLALYAKLPEEARRVKPKPAAFFDWSCDGQTMELVKAALATCKELFPSLSGNFLSKKTKPKKKANDGASQQERSAGTSAKKRKEPDGSYTIVKHFNVEIPEGLKTGDTFLTQIQTDDKIKRVRLTVPEGSPTSLRFALRVPLSAPSDEKEADQPAFKKARQGSGEEKS